MIRRLRRKFILVCMVSVFVVMAVVVALINGLNAYRYDARLDSMLAFLAQNQGEFPRMTQPEAPAGGGADSPAPEDDGISAEDGAAGNAAADADGSDGADGESASGGETDASAFDGDGADGESASGGETDASAFDGDGADGESAQARGRHDRRWSWGWDDRPFDSAEAPFMTRHFSVRFALDGAVVSTNTDSIAAITREQAVEYAQAALARGRVSGGYDIYRYLVSRDEDGTLVVFLDASNELRAGSQLLLISCAVGLLSFGAVFVLVLLFSRRAIRPIAKSIEKQRQFITDAGHELKTPLTIISANCEILELGQGENEWLSGIQKQVGRLRRLVNNLVTLSRMDEERPQAVKARFSLSDAVYDTAMTFATAAERADKRLSVLVEPDVSLTGDEASVRQMTSILLDNAVKYCDAGGDIAVELGGGKRPVLTVENAFREVDALELSRLFDRFYRADPARTSDGSYGLGLSIARSIAEAHHASIRAEKAGEGRVRMRVRF